MEERLRFVARLLDGEAMTELCREFGISRKTGYGHYVQVLFDGFDFPCRVTRRRLRICRIQPSIASNP